MKISGMEEICHYHMTVVLSHNEAFPKSEEAKPNKFSEAKMSLDKISDDMNITDLKREDTARHIYR